MSGPWTLSCCISSFVWAQTLIPRPLNTHPKLPLNPSRAEVHKLPSVWTRGHAVQLLKWCSCCLLVPKGCLKNRLLTALTTCTPSLGLSGALGSCQRRNENTKKCCSSDMDYNKHMQTQAHVKLSNLSIILSASISCRSSCIWLELQHCLCHYFTVKKGKGVVHLSQVLYHTWHMTASISWKSCAALWQVTDDDKKPSPLRGSLANI